MRKRARAENIGAAVEHPVMLLSWQQLRFGAGGLAFQVGAIFRMLKF
jgi:hypothetical protein